MNKQTISAFFEQSQGFLAAYQQIVDKGSFQSLRVDVGSNKGFFLNVNISAEGLVPDDPEDMAPGVRTYIDPSLILEKIRYQTEHQGYRFTSASCKVEQSTWSKFNASETKITGRLGQKIDLSLNVFLEWNNKRVKPPR